MSTSVLGPHVVGTRVVVRRLIPGQVGPTGGPAFTDLIGICTSWGPDSCVIAPESGDPVEIALGLIVAGKPVPPKPSVRLRVSARAAEGHAQFMWDDVERIALGEWELRAGALNPERVIKRANSCLALGEPDRPLESAAESVTAFYTERGLEPLIQTELDSATEVGLRELGWTPLAGSDTHFKLASTSRALRLGAVRRPTHGLGVDVAVTQLSGGARARITIGDDLAHPVAHLEAALDGDWVGINEVWVAPEHRRSGLAWAALGEGIEWGAEQGARTAWLHVETVNTGAMELYEQLGFMTHHTMRYLKAPTNAGC